MKRKLLICSSLITLLLSVFSVPIFAEETVQDSSNLHTLSDGVFLDQYFYDNYELLPYLESTGGYQIIDTGISAKYDLNIVCKFSYFDNTNGYPYLASDSTYANGIYITYQNNRAYFYFMTNNYQYPLICDPYVLNISVMDRNVASLNGIVHSFPESSFSTDTTYKLFNSKQMKLYSFSIYDYSLNDGEGGYVRYYYPAKTKSSSTLGLYDAVSKTFITGVSGTIPFTNPSDQVVMNYQITSFLANSLTWIGQIFDAIIQIPIIIVFMAIGLAGAMFRWGRRVVHF